MAPSERIHKNTAGVMGLGMSGGRAGESYQQLTGCTEEEAPDHGQRPGAFFNIRLQHEHDRQLPNTHDRRRTQGGSEDDERAVASSV
jgi:hypothetical protein